jgi:uncharacterized protein (DUF2062 family)
MREMVDWSREMGKPLAVGLVTLALSLAALGWVTVHLAWRAWVTHAWRKRRARRRKAPA